MNYNEIFKNMITEDNIDFIIELLIDYLIQLEAS